MNPSTAPVPRRPEGRSLGSFLVIGALILAPLTLVTLAGASHTGTATPPPAAAIAPAPGTVAPPADLSPDLNSVASDDCGSAEPCLVMSPAAAKAAPARRPMARVATSRPETLAASR